MKYLIGIDMDGTLLKDDKTISNYTQSVINKISGMGHQIVIATGRSYLGAIDYHRTLKLNTPLITLNGALISYPDGSKTEFPLPTDLVLRMFDDLKSLLITAIFNTSDTVFSYQHNKDLEYLFNGATLDNSQEFSAKDIANRNILNVIVLIKEHDRKVFERYFTDLAIKPRYWGTYNNEAFYDIYLETVSKASALKHVLNYYNVTKNDLITFGDSGNDLEMLLLANHGVAMKNARDEIKKATKHSTRKTNNEDGVADYLDNFFK